jgi:hypothetical protein
VIVPFTVKVVPTDVVPLTVKLGAVVEPAALPFATVPSIEEPVGAVVAVAVLDAVQVTDPSAAPLRLASAGFLGGDDHEISVLILPWTVAISGPQSAILGIGGGGALDGHPPDSIKEPVTRKIKKTVLRVTIPPCSIRWIVTNRPPQRTNRAIPIKHRKGGKDTVPTVVTIARGCALPRPPTIFGGRA